MEAWRLPFDSSCKAGDAWHPHGTRDSLNRVPRLPRSWPMPIIIDSGLFKTPNSTFPPFFHSENCPSQFRKAIFQPSTQGMVYVGQMECSLPAWIHWPSIRKSVSIFHWLTNISKSRSVPFRSRIGWVLFFLLHVSWLNPLCLLFLLLSRPQLHIGVLHINTRTVSAACARYPKG